MPLNWSNIWPGGEPFYTPAEEDTYIPTSGYENLDVTGRAQTNQQKKNEWMKNFYEENKDQLGTINPDLNQVNKGSMFPPWMGALMGTTAGGIYGAAKMAGSQGNEMMNAYNAANAAGLNLEDYIERDGTRVSINPEFYADEYAATPVDASGLFGQEQISPRPSGVFPETENLTSPFMEEPSGLGEGYDKRRFRDVIKDKFSGIPNAFANMINYRNPLSERSANFNPNLAGQIEDLRNIEYKDQFGKSRTGSWLGDQSSPYKITGGPLAGKNLVSGFGTNDYDEMLAKQANWFQRRKDEDKGFSQRKWDAIIAEQQARGRDIPVTTKVGVARQAPGDGGRYQPPTRAQNVARTASRVGPGGNVRAYGLSQGGYMRSRYNRGGRVGILSIF